MRILISKNISIIIINFRTPELTCQCIESIQKNVCLTHEIIVVDNFSNDNSKETITNKYPDIKWIQNSSNIGFSAANNIGVKAAKFENIIMLNSDVIILPDTIENLFHFSKQHEHFGIIGIQLLNKDKTPQKSTFEYPSVNQTLYQSHIFAALTKTNRSTDYAIMGSFIYITKTTFEQMGGFDEDYFLYSEEIDLCSRIKTAGKEVLFMPEVKAIHYHEGSQTDKKWNVRQRYLSKALFLFKSKGIFVFFSYILISILNSISNFFVLPVISKALRKEYFTIQYGFYSNFLNYFVIPFRYTREINSGKKKLKWRQ